MLIFLNESTNSWFSLRQKPKVSSLRFLFVSEQQVFLLRFFTAQHRINQILTVGCFWVPLTYIRSILLEKTLKTAHQHQHEKRIFQGHVAAIFNFRGLFSIFSRPDRWKTEQFIKFYFVFSFSCYFQSIKSLFTFKFSRLFVENLMPKFTRKFSCGEQLHIQQQKKQINKVRDENPITEKHLPRQRLDFIWDSRREKFKSENIFVVFEHEALRHMIGLMFSIGGKHSRATHSNKIFAFCRENFIKL